VLHIEDNDPNVKLVERLLRLRPGWRLIHAGPKTRRQITDAGAAGYLTKPLDDEELLGFLDAVPGREVCPGG